MRIFWLASCTLITISFNSLALDVKQRFDHLDKDKNGFFSGNKKLISLISFSDLFNNGLFGGTISKSNAFEAVVNNINMINFDKSAIFFDIKILLNESINYVISIYVQRFKCCFNYSI